VLRQDRVSSDTFVFFRCRWFGSRILIIVVISTQYLRSGLPFSRRPEAAAAAADSVDVARDGFSGDRRRFAGAICRIALNLSRNDALPFATRLQLWQ
jgi:hypothetical protein